MEEEEENRKRVLDEEEVKPTQPGDEDLDEHALDQILQKIPASKRQRAQQRLTQLGVADDVWAGAEGS